MSDTRIDLAAARAVDQCWFAILDRDVGSCLVLVAERVVENGIRLVARRRLE